jgi:hypothetical protein
LPTKKFFGYDCRQPAAITLLLISAAHPYAPSHSSLAVPVIYYGLYRLHSKEWVSFRGYWRWRVGCLRRDGFAVFGTLAEAALRLSRSKSAVIASGATFANEWAYDTWMRVFDEAPQRDRARHVERLASLKSRPVFSILTTSSDLDLHVIDRLARSLAQQFYQHWQLLVAGEQVIVGDLPQALANLCPNQSIEVYPRNSAYAATLNQLTSIARGEFLIPIPPDVILRPNALLELALTLDAHPTAAIIYSDEGRIGGNGERCEPLFKPAWSPDVFDVADYVGNLTALRRDMVDAVGGWRSDLEAASQYDLRMRVIDRVQPTNIVHLAKILVQKPSTKRNATPRRRIERVIHDHCARQSIKAEIVWPDEGLVPRLRYQIPEPPPLVSLIISTRDRADILEMCVRSTLNLTRYEPYEVLIVDNDSKDVVTHRLFTALRADDRVNVLQVSLLRRPRIVPFARCAAALLSAEKLNGPG